MFISQCLIFFFFIFLVVNITSASMWHFDFSSDTWHFCLIACNIHNKFMIEIGSLEVKIPNRWHPAMHKAIGTIGFRAICSTHMFTTYAYARGAPRMLSLHKLSVSSIAFTLNSPRYRQLLGARERRKKWGWSRLRGT